MLKWNIKRGKDRHFGVRITKFVLGSRNMLQIYTSANHWINKDADDYKLIPLIWRFAFSHGQTSHIYLFSEAQHQNQNRVWKKHIGQVIGHVSFKNENWNTTNENAISQTMHFHASSCSSSNETQIEATLNPIGDIKIFIKTDVCSTIQLFGDCVPCSLFLI